MPEWLTAAPAVAFWGAALILFCVVEAATVSLVSVWFAGGALVALIAAALHVPFWVQIALFLAVSGVLLVLLRPLAHKMIRTDVTATNADRNIGRQVMLHEAIDPIAETGLVRMDGVEWSARALDGGCIPAGTLVTISEIRGSRLLVTRAQ